MDRNKSIDEIYQSYIEAEKTAEGLENEICQHEKEILRCSKIIESLQNTITIEKTLINQKTAKLEEKCKEKEEASKSAFLSLSAKEEKKLKNAVIQAEMQVECMICLESCQLAENVRTICSRNHWVCSNCHDKIQICPLCKEEIGNTLKESKLEDMDEFKDLASKKQFYESIKTMYSEEAYIGGKDCNFVKLRQKNDKIYLEAFEFAEGKVIFISKWNDFVVCIEEGENKVLKVFNNSIDILIAKCDLNGEITGLTGFGDLLVVCFKEGEFNMIRISENTLKVENCDFMIEDGIKCANSTTSTLIIADFEGNLYKYTSYLESSKHKTKPISCIKIKNNYVFTADNTYQIAIWSLKELSLRKNIELKTCFTSQFELYNSKIVAITDQNTIVFYDMDGAKSLEIKLKQGKFFKLLVDSVLVLDLTGTATLFSAKEGTVSSKIQYSVCEPISIC